MLCYTNAVRTIIMHDNVRIYKKENKRCQFFDFNATPDEKKPAECTYTVIRSNENEATIEKPMMILDNKQCKWEHHPAAYLPIRSRGHHSNFSRKTEP